MIDPTPKKTLGQHWLRDETALIAMCDAANIGPADVVLEIGPGLGTLTEHLVQRAGLVIAVEFDEVLAAQLPGRLAAENLQVHHADIARFNLGDLPSNYKVVANLPYYITSKVVRLLLESANPPRSTTLLIQKEVAERIAAGPGDMSILAVAAQYFAVPTLGPVISAHLFTPPPKVDSQIITLTRREAPLFADLDATHFFQVVRAGFGEKRKQLHNSLAGGLHLDKKTAEHLLDSTGIPAKARAEQLTLDDWYRLAKAVNSSSRLNSRPAQKEV